MDQALYAVIMEAYISGVSTRKVDALVGALGLTARHISAATVIGQPAVGSGVAVAASQSA